jgi:hypothetical protein
VLKKLYTSVASFFSESFFSFVLQMFVSSRKRNTLFFFNMFSSRQLRISFFKFLIGNDGSRLSFFLFRISSNASFFFVLWFFNLYKKLFFSLFFFCIKTDFVISFLISSNMCSVLPFILRFATIFSYCQSFFLCVDMIRTFSFSVQSYLIFQYRIPSHMYNLCSNFFYLVMHFKLYRAHGGLLRFLRAKALNNLVYQIEHSFFFSSNSLHFISARFYYKSVPPITNAKMVCDVVVITMSLGLNLRSAFSKILNWQTHWQNYYNDNTVAFINRYKVNIGNFVYPLKGIRLDCSGPPYKARRTSRSQYHLWVSNELLTGKMPLSFVDLQIDYYQSVVIIRRSNIGVKV